MIADTYIIEALIGQGGMGSVFLATHNRLPGKRVAIKMLHVELNNEEVLARFRREATIATQLDHPNIVRVDDFNVHEDGTPYLILEYLEGENLAQRLRAGPLPLEQVMSIMRMVGSAIAAAHQLGYVHRDLKPQNIFLIPTEIDGHYVEVAKVLDFGISKLRNSTTVKTQENTLLGTPQYMAPEQASAKHGDVDERTDIFALGAIVYEMLAGAPAFAGESIPAVVYRVVHDDPDPLAKAAPGTPPAVIAAVEKAMQKDQASRYATVAAFIEALTGRPLAQRSSMISINHDRSASGSPDRPRVTATTGNKQSGQAAFASTVDSGSLSKQDTVSPHAATLASQDGSKPAPPTVDTSGPTVTDRPGSRAWILVLAVIGALALGAVLFVLLRGDARPVTVPADAATPIVVADIDAVLPVDAAVDAVELDAALPIDAAVKAPDAGAPRKVPPNTLDRTTGDPLAWEWLDKAQAAFRAGNLDAAKLHCNSVIDNSQTASATQRSLALVLRGSISCTQQNLGQAQADLRAIPIASYRSTLLARCKAAGQPLQ